MVQCLYKMGDISKDLVCDLLYVAEAELQSPCTRVGMTSQLRGVAEVGRPLRLPVKITRGPMACMCNYIPRACVLGRSWFLSC
jgi:hypothetical protein